MANLRFPYSDPLKYQGYSFSVDKVLSTVGEMLTQERRQKITEIVEDRTYNVCLVLDQIYDRGNASAVMRSAEAMGYQTIHVIETDEKFKEANRVTQGADKWLHIERWKTPMGCVQRLKAEGYQICATSLEASVPISEVDFTQPTALVLGNEKEGVCQEILTHSDVNVILPMQGFVQSYNISVAGALCCYHIYQDRVRRQGFHGDLSSQEKEILKAHYFLRSQPLGVDVLNL